jgi:hypothetical protein
MGGRAAQWGTTFVALRYSKPASGGVMPENDDNPPDNVIPFGHMIPWTIADELRRFYGALVDEPLPANIAALSRELAAKLGHDKEKKDQAKQDKEEDKEKV